MTTTPSQKEYIITEKVLDDVAKYARGSWVDAVRSRPLSAELETAYMNGFNDGQAEERGEP